MSLFEPVAYFHVVTFANIGEFHSIVKMKLRKGIDPYFRAAVLHRASNAQVKDNTFKEYETVTKEISEIEVKFLFKMPRDVVNNVAMIDARD